jgi:DNA polymerase I
VPPLLVLDGDSLAHRSYHALPRSIRDARGRPANMVVGFADTVVTLWGAERPRTVLACWDTVGAPTWRHELLPGYQGGRDFPDDLVAQLELLPELVAAAGFANAKGAGLEADDFLAASVAAETGGGGEAVVITSDRDAYQLVCERVTVVRPLRGASLVERVGPEEVVERYGVRPDQVTDFIALRGDPSDRIPGARGIGPKKAAQILAAHGSLEAALAAGMFPTEADDLRRYRHIATMRADALIPDLPDTPPDWAAAAALVRGWGLAGVADRLAASGVTAA